MALCLLFLYAKFIEILSLIFLVVLGLPVLIIRNVILQIKSFMFAF